jgi:hypothetical protein
MFVPLCRNCGTEIRHNDRFCPSCGHPRQGAEATRPRTSRKGEVVGPDVAKRTEPISEAERSRRLDEAIKGLLLEGYFVRLRTPTAAQLVKPKVFSLVWALVWFLLCGVGVLVYVFYYASKRDEGVYLQVDDYGNTTLTHQLG